MMRTLDYINSCCSMIRLGKNKRENKPWYDDKLREQRKYRRKTSKIWYKYKETHQ